MEMVINKLEIGNILEGYFQPLFPNKILKCEITSYGDKATIEIMDKKELKEELKEEGN